MPPARNADSQSTWRARRAIIRFVTPLPQPSNASAALCVGAATPNQRGVAEHPPGLRLDLLGEQLRQSSAEAGPQHMLCRVGEPAEVVSVFLFLCGPGASLITGTDVLVLEAVT